MENSKTPVRSIGMLRSWLPASVVLLIGMFVLYYQTKQQYTGPGKENDVSKIDRDTAKNRLDRIVQEQKQVVATQHDVVNMVGTKVAPKSSANIYWDSLYNVYLVVKNMPKLQMISSTSFGH